MKTRYDLSKLEWSLSGYFPFIWKFAGIGSIVDVGPIRANVPGSVQKSLLDSGIIEDWNVGVNSRYCEWVENRHWLYEARIPDEWMDEQSEMILECLGLDYSGWIYVNGEEVAAFKGTHIPHILDLTGSLRKSDNVLQIIFDLPPRWLGQFGYTSRMTEWKTRFNYTWDWIPRLVQIGVWDSISLIVTDGNKLENVSCTTDATVSDGTGIIRIQGKAEGDKAAQIHLTLFHEHVKVLDESISVSQFEQGMEWKGIPVKLWWPVLEGEQPLYEAFIQLVDTSGGILDTVSRSVGFKHIDWISCEDAPREADPWICVVNGKPLFLQGVNFAPIRPNFADLTRQDYEKRLRLYHEMGCNMLRINGCGFLEFEAFYDLCDELGILVWQEFPLTSSGVDNWPPEDETSISELETIARSFIIRRQHHVSLTMWAGGNELQGALDGSKIGAGKPCDAEHPMLKRLKEVVEQDDPTRRYIPTSPSGPRGIANEEDFGNGLHWDVHGPYSNFNTKELALQYWSNDDALFRSEMTCPGANPVELIRLYKGKQEEFPPTKANEYWCRPTTWWIDWDLVTKRYGREPETLEEYVAWSQETQAQSLSLGMRMCKERFPKCGGVLLWGSQDTYPLPINTSIIDFNGNPKPAALSLAKVWRGTK